MRMMSRLLGFIVASNLWVHHAQAPVGARAAIDGDATVGPKATGDRGVKIADDFERPTAKSLGSNWTEEQNGFEIINDSDARGKADDSFAKNLAIHVTDTATVNQYVRIKAQITGRVFPGVALRYDTSSTGHYLCDWSTAAFYWSYDANAASGSQRNIIDGQSISFTSGDAVGITIIGTGANTRLRVWLNVTALAPDAGGKTWDSAAPAINELINAGPTADTGKGTGICMFWQPASGTTTIEDFHAGDIR